MHVIVACLYASHRPLVTSKSSLTSVTLAQYNVQYYNCEQQPPAFNAFAHRLTHDRRPDIAERPSFACMYSLTTV